MVILLFKVEKLEFFRERGLVHLNPPPMCACINSMVCFKVLQVNLFKFSLTYIKMLQFKQPKSERFCLAYRQHYVHLLLFLRLIRWNVYPRRIVSTKSGRRRSRASKDCTSIAGHDYANRYILKVHGEVNIVLWE